MDGEMDVTMSVSTRLAAAVVGRDGGCISALMEAEEAHPADLASVYEHADGEGRFFLLTLIPGSLLPEFLQNLPPADAVGIMAGMPDVSLGGALEAIPDDVLVDLLQEMPAPQRGHAFHLLSEDRRRAAHKLLRFPEDSAGGRMTTAFATIREDMTVRDAVNALRGLAEQTELLSRIYVVDHEGLILGKVRLRDLTFSSHVRPIAELNDGDTRSVLATADQENAVRVMMKYDLMAMPVVDDDGRLLGIITHDDALEIQEEESTEDLERQSGISGDTAAETYLNTPVLREVSRRVGWIVSLAFLGLLSGCLIYGFQNQLSAVFALTIYMPMIVAAGGNTGGQAATMVVRAMSLGEFAPAAVLRVAWKELRVGVIIGAIVAVAMALQIYFLRPDFIALGEVSTWRFVLTVAGALVSQITASTLIGAVLPVAAKAARLDPAVIASPAITTIVDATGLLIYLNLARLILHL